MMLHYIRLQVIRHPTLSRSVVITDLYFTRQLFQYHSDFDTKEPRRSYLALNDVQAFLSSGIRDIVYVVFNPGRDHWAIVKIDYKGGTYAWGDSLAGTRLPDRHALAALESWLCNSFSSKPFTRAPDLPCARQNDGWSCGIAACTLISSLLGLDDKWSPNKAKLLRYKWAYRLIATHLQTAAASMPLDTSDSGIEHLAPSIASSVPKEVASKMALGLILNKSESEGVLLVQNNTSHHSKQSLSAPALPTSCSEALPAELPLSSLLPSRASLPVISSSPPARITQLGKRRRSLSIDSAKVKHKSTPKLKTNLERESYGVTGISESPVTARARKEAVASGAVQVKRAEMNRFLQHIHTKHDPKAHLEPNDLTYRTVTHSTCNNPIHLDGPLLSGKFARHVKTCDANAGMRKNGKMTKAALNTHKLSDMFARMAACAPPKTPSNHSSDNIVDSQPELPPTGILCRGLRPEHDERITQIIERAPHGGTISVNRIAYSEYNRKEYHELSPEERKSVRVAASATAQWICHYEPYLYIRHAKCETYCDPSWSDITPNDICSRCADLLHTRAFQTAMNCPVAPEENLKFAPKTHRGKTVAMLYAQHVGLKDLLENSDETSTMLADFARKVLSGRFKDNKVFLGLVEAMVLKDDKLMRSKGMQNFRYPPALLDFLHTAYVSSPRTYRSIQRHFLGPVMQAKIISRKRRSRAAKFPISICDKSFSRAVDFLSTIQYAGPTALSCDDTQLFARLSPYFDAESSQWVILGTVGEPVKVDGAVEDIEELLSQVVEGQEKATKVSFLATATHLHDNPTAPSMGAASAYAGYFCIHPCSNGNWIFVEGGQPTHIPQLCHPRATRGWNLFVVIFLRWLSNRAECSA
ncbi:hypothetical protein FRC09_019931 [Ceratobasidium sp. 395]|nr:hypothetical protein FRC09_019931 [Ceratobasidium sp. 395]